MNPVGGGGGGVDGLKVIECMMYSLRDSVHSEVE